MLLIFGLRGYVRQLAIVLLVCHSCGNPAAHRIEERTRKATLFFVPLFQISRKQTLTCTFCARTTSISADQAAHYASLADATSATIEPAPRS